MLPLLDTFFKRLHKQRIPYGVYKGLSSLQEDLQGKRGDIDIITSPEQYQKLIACAQESGFRLARNARFPHYLQGFDLKTHKAVLLDVNKHFNFGPKPFMPYQLRVPMDALSLDTKKPPHALAPEDYSALMLFMRLTLLKPKHEGLAELKAVMARLPAHPKQLSALQEMWQHATTCSWASIQRDVARAKSWNELIKAYRHHLVDYVEKDPIRTLKASSPFWGKLVKYMRYRIAKLPAYRIRKKGFLVAFVGVDGAGKSSAVDYLSNIDYFKRTGLKAIYFGNNHYWIPGLTKLASRPHKQHWVNVLASILSQFDRQLRILGAMYAIYMGNIVVADRYFYDDAIGRSMQPEKPRSIKTAIQWLIRPRMWKTPEITIFLDVSPDVAFKRKQDYAYEKMVDVNTAYKNYMTQQAGVTIINADEAEETVRHNVVKTVYEFDSTWG